MTEPALSHSKPDSDLRCSNCGRGLDATDKFCRDCGLPTIRRVQLQRSEAAMPPDSQELRRAMDVAADPEPFMRIPPAMSLPDSSRELTTGGVLRVTSPTMVTRMAASTLLMVGLIMFMIGLGVLLLVLAFK